MRAILHYLRRFVVLIIKCLIYFIPKNRNLILFSSWFGKKYSDSSMYQFEYMLNNSKYIVYWYTKDKELYKKLQNHKLPVVYSLSLKGIWMQIRAVMLVSSVQLNDFNSYFLSRCIYFDLDHGFVLKDAGFKIPGISSHYVQFQHLLRWGCQYWMSAPTKWSMEKISYNFDIPANKIVRCPKPRTDALFDITLQRNKNVIVEELKQGRKCIVWMPTHRNCGMEKMNSECLLNLSTIQNICEEYNIVFFIKKHFYHRHEIENLVQYHNIFDLTAEDIDAQVLLSQADALISDYSASYMEYLILDRPIILYAYDKEKYIQTERGLYIPLENNTAGEVVLTKEDLDNSIRRIVNDWKDVSFSKGRALAREYYYDTTFIPGQNRKEVANIIDQLIAGTYKPNWTN